MIKNYCLGDFAKLIQDHEIDLTNLESQHKKLSHKLLLETFINSDKSIARKFNYVIGSMQGSQDLQFQTMLDRLEKSGKKSMVQKLKSRKNLPCIDIQECIWLLNEKSNRDRNRSYNYSDYFSFSKKQFISGSATNFAIDWSLLTSKQSKIKENHSTSVSKSKKEKPKSTSRPVVIKDKDGKQAEEYVKAFNLEAFRKIIDTYKNSIELKPTGWWKTATAQEFWDEFCMQIMVTQATRSGQEIVYRDSGAWSNLSLDNLRSFKTKKDQDGLRQYLENELSRNGMRMAAKKAESLSRAVFNSRIIDEDLSFILVSQISNLWDRSVSVREIYNNELKARDNIKATVFGFGDKSASDFLLEIGFADYLIAFDVRVLAILRTLGLIWLDQDRIQNDPHQYLKLQDFIFNICEKEQISLRTIDRIFYQKKDEILIGDF